MTNILYVYTKKVIVLCFFIFIFTSYSYAAGEQPDLVPTPTIVSDNSIHVKVQKDNIIYVGGEFRQINGQSRNFVAAFDKSTGELTPWNPPLTQPVRDIHISDDGSEVYFSSQKNPNKNKDLYIAVYNMRENTFTTYLTPAISLTASPSAVITLSTESTSATGSGLMVDRRRLGFVIPDFSDILTFIIRGFFVVTGLAALFYLLMGALSWVTAGGDKDKINEARSKITSAVVGLLMVIIVLAVVVTLEQIVFRRTLCFGLSCPATIPVLLRPI